MFPIATLSNAVQPSAPGHPLAKIKGTVSRAAVSKHVQLVLTDPGAKHALLRAGLGWDGMPLHMGEQDLADKSPAKLQLKAHPLLGTAFSMHAIWLKDQPPGPAEAGLSIS